MPDYDLEIHKLLKLGEHSHSSDLEHDHAPKDLPTHGHTNKSDNVHTPPPVVHIEHSGHGAAEAALTGMEHIEVDESKLKSLIVYPIIFLAAFVFFYVLLNFSSISGQVSGLFSKPQAEQIMGEQSAEYYSWIGNYFYAVGDRKLLEPTNDIDKDGLSNSDEFIIRTNPILADSDTDGFSDGIEIINSTNPWGPGNMNKTQSELIAKLDLIMINNRISFNVSQTGSVSGMQTNNFDLERPGRLSIPKLKLQVDLIWTKDPSEFDRDLTRGVVHYPGTALPGENGIIYVSGHSSDYIWKRDPMANIFSRLNHLAPGDDIFIDVYGKDGKVYNFRYQVTGNKVYKPDDQVQFVDNSGLSKLHLSTCWPIGTQKDRLVVTAIPVDL